jgi:parvulin-like peptidyl-prolyl isomerase
MPNPTSHPLLRLAVVFVSGAMLAGSTGCSYFRKKPQPTVISSGSFHSPITTLPATDSQPTPAETAEPAVAAGQPQVLTPSSEAVLVTSEVRPAPSAQAPAADPAVSAIAPEVSLAEQVRENPPTPEATPPGVTRSQPAAPIAMSGTYMTIGGVLAEVNGVPIFAARVMKELEPTLAALARELDARPFEVEARNFIERTVREFISEELEYAAAQRNLSAEDRKLADFLTTDYRQMRIREAGGSIENAKRLSAEAGEDFEQQVEEQNRRYLIGIYYEKKVRPRVSNATPADMRRFYRDNVAKLYTEQTEATFFLIRVDPARHGGKQPALDRILSFRDRVSKGEAFATLAATANDDATLTRSGGKLGPVAKDSFALEKVEAAVFATQPGQLTDIIEDRGGFYLALVDTIKLGKVLAFDDPAVQRDIRSKLLNTEIGRMRDQARAELERNATIRRDPRMLQTAVEMAVQRYPLWREQK